MMALKLRLPSHPNEPQSYDWGFHDGFVDKRARTSPEWAVHPDEAYERGYWAGRKFYTKTQEVN